jgi:hypothetical protein
MTRYPERGPSQTQGRSPAESRRGGVARAATGRPVPKAAAAKDAGTITLAELEASGG